MYYIISQVTNVLQNCNTSKLLIHNLYNFNDHTLPKCLYMQTISTIL
jgi:hypothetical protein